MSDVMVVQANRTATTTCHVAVHFCGKLRRCFAAIHLVPGVWIIVLRPDLVQNCPRNESELNSEGLSTDKQTEQ